MDEKRSYYAIIPANVRYDKSLSPNAKLLYGEITALCSEKGYCWSTNKYFSDLFGVSQKSISKWISMLAKKKYLFIRMVYRKGTKEILERHLSIVKEPLEERSDSASCDTPPIEEKLNTPMEEKFHTPGKKGPYPIEEKFHTPMEEKFQENITETDGKGNKSVSQSKEKQEVDELTDEIRERLKEQIEYDYFEENLPEDLPGVNALIDCMAEILIAPRSKINGSMQPRAVLKPYIDKADSESVRGFLDHMRGKPMRDVKNIRSYWQSAFVNFIREEELVKLTL
ncbi:Helix-turn-helix domain protein [Caprobacter fermentans]|uniref:Helix-turn-helix domain protein n=1 Tax=Caproicibacter fermentans TaxID=2576756 RepID=A0A6N8HZQ5_9FIRM|nr:helix-turn-helix domain-containing protein [Caproicibacter fermentans]MVB11364.1 Helix-turn-helix domain protein [Caproicibacter fermentans]